MFSLYPTEFQRGFMTVPAAPITYWYQIERVTLQHIHVMEGQVTSDRLYLVPHSAQTMFF